MQQICHQCSTPFEITAEDLAFYDSVSPVIAGKKFPLPSPDACPSCRYRQRLTWRNERTLYRRTCSATGKNIVSIFSPDKAWPPVYDQTYWWSDQWDPKEYGRDFDFSRPFFQQWAELFRSVPQIALNNQQSENCEYTNQSERNKDSYMLFCCDMSRDCYHGMLNSYCTNCCDCSYLGHSELCYGILNGINCYRCIFSENIENCSEVAFCRNCIGCKNCFGCINLRNKEFYFLNEKCSPEEFASKMQASRLDQMKSITDAQKQTNAFFDSFPHKYYEGANIFESSGNYLHDSSDTHDCFNCRSTEHIRNCQDVWRADHCQDMTEMVDNRFCYSLEGCAESERTLFSKKFYGLHDSCYCSHCHFSNHLFGCIGLRHAQYCILNKQYTKEEYELLAAKIIEHMQRTGEWGHHFPSEYSPFAYNETVAQEYFPMTKKEVEAKGWQWRDQVDDAPKVDRIIASSELPDSIEDIPDDILNWAIECDVTKRPFKIIKQELAFYRQMRLPVPHLHPDERYRRRMALRNPRKLWDRECGKCKKPIATSYAPDRPELVFCEKCYLKEVY